MLAFISFAPGLRGQDSAIYSRVLTRSVGAGKDGYHIFACSENVALPDKASALGGGRVASIMAPPGLGVETVGIGPTGHRLGQYAAAIARPGRSGCCACSTRQCPP